MDYEGVKSVETTHQTFLNRGTKGYILILCYQTYSAT